MTRLLSSVALWLLCGTAAISQRAPEAYEKGEVTISPADQRQIQQYWDKVESGMRLMQEVERATTLNENEDEEAPELRKIKARIDAAEQDAQKSLGGGRVLALGLGGLGLLALIRALKDRFQILRRQCSCRRSDFEVRPLLYGVAATVVCVLVAAIVGAYVIIPLFSGPWGRFFLQTILFGIGLSPYVVSGVVVALKARRNKVGHAFLFSVGMIMVDLIIKSNSPDAWITALNLLFAIPLTVVGAAISEHPWFAKWGSPVGMETVPSPAATTPS